MAVRVVVGAQYGDEGKGKMIDWLARDADLVVRYQGGDNAGHTVINDYGVFKLHLVPCGIFNPRCRCLVGTGTAVNPDVLLAELDMLVKAGVDVSGIALSEKAQILLPWHVSLDAAAERSGGIGTTRRGVGPAYAGKMLRSNLRAGDLRDLSFVRERLAAALPFTNAQLEFFGERTFTLEEIMERSRLWRVRLLPLLCDPIETAHSALSTNKNILFEGQLGAMKDIDHGIYPYVTASHPVAAYAAVSGGFSPKRIDTITGVCKAFSTAVGDGPFPTEMAETDAATIRGTGAKPDDEYGARTGRARRIGWLDLPVLRYANLLNGFDELALTKLDRLDALHEIKMCTGYRLDGQPLRSMPDTRDLRRVTPEYEVLPGWLSDTTACRTFDDLPVNAQRYVKAVVDAAGVPVRYIGNGPRRENIIVV